MITSSGFYQLNYQQQADLLLGEGTYLLSRFEDTFIVDLYELHDLLVEVFYQQDNEDLVSVMAYKTSEKLKSLSKGMNLKPRLRIKNEGTSFQNQNEYFA